MSRKAVIIEPSGNVTNQNVRNAEMADIVEVAMAKSGALRSLLAHTDVIYTGLYGQFTKAIQAYFEQAETPDVEVRPYYKNDAPDGWTVHEFDGDAPQFVADFHHRNDILLDDEDDSVDIVGLYTVSDSKNSLQWMRNQALKAGVSTTQIPVKNSDEDGLFEYDF